MKKWGQRIFLCGMLFFFAAAFATLVLNDGYHFVVVPFVALGIGGIVIGGWMRIFELLNRAWKFLTDKRWT